MESVSYMYRVMVNLFDKMIVIRYRLDNEEWILRLEFCCIFMFVWGRIGCIGWFDVSEWWMG